MHFSMVLTLAGAASVAATVNSPFALMARQDRECVPVPDADGPTGCERSCGPGYIQCVRYPTCYNPSIGHTCCSNGKYCKAGTYCTDIGCCPDDLTLEECGANSKVPTVAPPSEGTPTPTSGGGSMPSSTPPYPTPSEEPTMPTGSSGLPQPTQSPPIYTGGADVNVNGGVRGFALGGLGLLAMWL